MRSRNRLAAAQYVAYARYACGLPAGARGGRVVGNDFDEASTRIGYGTGSFISIPGPTALRSQATPLPVPGLVERITRRSALALYLMRNVGIRGVLPRVGINLAQAETRYVGQTDADPSPARADEGHRVIDWFLNELPGAACLPARDIVIVVDTPRPEVYDAQSLAAAQTSYFGLMRQRIMSEARARGFQVVDTEPHFVAAYAADPQRFEHPTDGHWNAHGHAVVAAAVREALAGWPPLAAVPTP